MNHHEETRFWEKVIKGPTENACWIWVGAIGDDGYGRFWTQAEDGTQRMLRAHRAAAEIIHGLEEISGHLVTHLCDNPLCVRAELEGAGHLFIGTHAENMAEREHRGRGNLHNPLCDTKAAPHALLPLDCSVLTPAHTGTNSGRLTSLSGASSCPANSLFSKNLQLKGSSDLPCS